MLPCGRRVFRSKWHCLSSSVEYFVSSVIGNKYSKLLLECIKKMPRAYSKEKHPRDFSRGKKWSGRSSENERLC